ncbi:hypothetical protein P2H44_12770 [Albimonas sp. CAU 1670]|uniref:hypothetical protein n=1 Tax=Albimonas sp. CAU 1670 TaxID=3032599 RepID=UPI0023D9A0B3|nr:hypothetical protein [Albimonas sp. CAU 1670]MDF2233426.1 hypothetical protein [Albimonas sp. CAU 1670]
MSSRRIAPLAAALLLAGCAGAGTVSQVDRSPGSAGQIRVFLATQPVAQVVGTPPDGATAEAVTAALRAPASQGGKGFGPAGPGTDPRLVISFAGGSPDALCAGSTPGGGAAADGRLEALIVYCAGGASRGSARVASGAVAGPSSPGFSDLFATAFGQMARQRQSGGDGRG